MHDGLSHVLQGVSLRVGAGEVVGLACSVATAWARRR
jgi:hypothetical protein